MQDLKELLGGHLLAVPFVLADDGHLSFALDTHGELVPLVSLGHQVGLDVGVAPGAAVLLQAGDEYGVGRGLPNPLAQVGDPWVLDPAIEKIWTIKLGKDKLEAMDVSLEKVTARSGPTLQTSITQKRLTLFMSFFRI